MKSITLHKLDPDVASELEQRARDQGRSLNRTAQELLRTALGLQRGKGTDRTESFHDLFNSWNREELLEFNKRSEDLGRVDPAEWED